MPVLFFVFVSGFASDFASDLVSGFPALQPVFSGSASARYFPTAFAASAAADFPAFHQLVHRLLYRFHRFAVDRLLYGFLHLLCRNRGSLLFLCSFRRFFRYFFLCFSGSLCCFLYFYCFFRFPGRFYILSGFLLCCRFRCSFCFALLLLADACLRLRIRKYLNRKRCEFYGNRIFPLVALCFFRHFHAWISDACSAIAFRIAVEHLFVLSWIRHTNAEIIVLDIREVAYDKQRVFFLPCSAKGRSEDSFPTPCH